MANSRNKLVPDVQVHEEKKVECLGIVFESDEERRRYFADRLVEALNELEEKLSGVAFRSVDDTVERLNSLSKWPMGDAGQIRNIAQRMRHSESQKDLLQRWKDEVGFPHGSIEDIMNLSDPPYYTSCPNPFIQDFVKCHGRPYDPDEKYHREPFAADVSEGKNDPIYNAHSYHTKVPHKAIMRYILHYTEPGDIVFDGFCGTGMTGVAAQLCGDRKTVESLGYRVERDGTILEREEGDNGKTVWKPFSKLGSRKAILNDLSPAATFIAYNYNTPVDVKQFEREAKRILAETEKECGWMYATLNTKGIEIRKETVDELASKVRLAKSVDEVRQIMKANSKVMGKINYTVWSDVFICPNCSKEIVFWDVAVDKEAGKVKDVLSCLHCRKADLRKRDLEPAWTTTLDKGIGETINQTIQVPVMVNYTAGKRRFEKAPDSLDMAIIEKIEEFDIPYWYPNWPMMFTGEQWGDSWRAGYHAGITHVHHFYTTRNLSVLSVLHAKIPESNRLLRFWLTSIDHGLGKRVKHGNWSFPMSILSGTLYIPALSRENNPLYFLGNKMKRIDRAFHGHDLFGYSSTMFPQNAGSLFAGRNNADYIFTDPPFGSNLMYSELNFLWEAWLRVFTNNKEEAIENKVQGKGLVEYQEIMERCFKEYYRVLKPGRWMTVEFHNSRNSVWNAIQEALWTAGFVVADVRTLDKQQGTFKQVTSAGAVKQDLVISAYKPNEGLEERFKLTAGTEEGVWQFVRTHLRQLVSVSAKEGELEIQQERMNYLLYDRMVSFHVQRGIMVPLSAAQFYAGLEQRFPVRDGMYFLPDQAAEYDKKRMRADRVQQLALFVSDENSALLWLRQQLSRKPQTFQELHPQFTKDSRGWLKFEKPIELQKLLADSFLRYDGTGPIPNQIVSWLKLSEKHRPKIRELEEQHGSATSLGLETSDPELIGAARDRWYLPDPSRAADLEKLRERALLKEFGEYKESTQKRLRVFRLEAVRAGFKKAWQDKDYETIIEVAEKIRPLVLQEDQKLLMWYHQALTRTGRD